MNPPLYFDGANIGQIFLSANFFVKKMQKIVKFIVFNVATIVSYLVIIYVFRIPIEDMGAFGRYTILILLGMGNVMFVVYDMAVSKLIDEYMFKLHRRVGRMLK